MNTLTKSHLTALVLKAPVLSRATARGSIEIRHLVLVSRILFLLITIGFIGYTIDRFFHSLQNSSS